MTSDSLPEARATLKTSGISTSPIFLSILVTAFALRLYVAVVSPYIWDEQRDWIPLAESISLESGRVSLPIRGDYHPALPAYFIKASSSLLGRNRLGFRFSNVLAGLFTILVVFQIAQQAFGPRAGRWAAALLAFNEYHIGVSAFATEKSAQLLFVSLALYAFSRFLNTSNGGYLYLTSAMTGLGFICKESSSLLLPVFFLTLLKSGYRHWLGSKHVYLASLVFLVVIGPDLFWHSESNHATAQVTYWDHLARIGGIGFTTHHFLFFGRDTLQAAYRAFTGENLVDYVPEYPSMNSLFGLILLGGVLAATLRSRTENGVQRLLLSVFWTILGFFVLVHPGTPPKGLDPVAWFWVDITLLPTVILAGHYLGRATGWWRIVAYCLTAAAGLYATALTIGRFN